MKNFSILDVMDIARALGQNPLEATPHSVFVFLRDNYLKPSGGGFNYNPAIEALRFGLDGKFSFDDAIHHVTSVGAPFGQKYNRAVIEAIWPIVEENEDKAYTLKYSAVPLRRINGKTIYMSIKSPVLTVNSDREISIKLTNFRNTFAPNFEQKRFMMSTTNQVLARDDFDNASVDLIEARSINGEVERSLSRLNSSEVDLFDIDRVEDLLTIYTNGVEMLFENGYDTREADLSRFRVVNPDAPDLFR